MSTPILPFAPWAPGTNQNSIPANDNSLRQQILNGLIISDSTDAQPGSPADGDAYIMTGAASGAQWATFDEFDLAIFDSGTWYAYAPVEGIIVNIAGAAFTWDGAAYVAVTTGGGVDWGDIAGTLDDQTDLAEALDEVSIVTEGSAFTIVPATHAGRRRYIRAGGDVTFDSAEAMAAGQVYTLRATGTIDLVEDGVTLTPPSGGTLELTVGMAVTVVMTSGTAGDVIGQTVPA